MSACGRFHCICKILEAFDDEIDLAEIPSDTDSIVDEVEVFDEENLQELFDAIVEDDNEDVGIVEREEGRICKGTTTPKRWFCQRNRKA